MEITCTCKICKRNAEIRGLPSLRARCDDPRPEVQAKARKEPHGFVYAAHERNFVGETVRRTYSLTPIES